MIHLRGHTPGSIALCYDAGGELSDTPHLFTGDPAPRRPGNTEHDPKRFGQLMDDLEERGFGTCPDGALAWPRQGHHAGYRAPARSGVARPGMVTAPPGVVMVPLRLAHGPIWVAYDYVAQVGTVTGSNTPPHVMRRSSASGTGP